MLCVGLLSKLQTVASGRHNALGAPTGCLENTRVVVLDTLMSWAEDSTSTQYVYWLSGLAGTGKTAIMRTLCDELAKRQLLGASFFISRTAGNRRDVRSILHTIIDQLAHRVAALRKPICGALDSNPDVVEQALECQLRDLLENTYGAAANDFSHPIVLVIDAFDECKKDKDSGRHGGDFLPLLLRALSRCQPNLKLVITSRLDQPILDMFKDVNPTTMRLHEMDSLAVHSDMRLYFQKGFEHIATRRRLSLQGSWPTENDIDLLVRRADKLFVFAATLLKYIGHSAFYPPDRLNFILRGAPSPETSHAFHELDRLYSIAMQDAITPPEDTSVGEQDEIVVQLYRLLSILLVIQKPPSIADLAAYVNEREEIVRLRLESVSAMVLVPEDSSTQDVRFFHASFPDYLVDPSRCTNQRFHLGVGQSHSILLLGMLGQNLSAGYFRGTYTAEYWTYHMYRAPLSVYEEALSTCQYVAKEAAKSELQDIRYMVQHYLALLHRSRYLRVGTTADLDTSIALERQNLQLCAVRDSKRDVQLQNLAAVLLDQFWHSSNLEALVESLQLDREALALRPPGHPNRHYSLNNLAVALRELSRCSDNPEALAESLQLGRDAIALRPPGHPDRHYSLENLAASLHDEFRHSGNPEALIESVQLGRETLALRPPGHPDRHHSLNSLASALIDQFEQFGDSEAIDDVVQLYRDMLTLHPLGHPQHSNSLNNLGWGLYLQYQHSHSSEALRDAILLFETAIELFPTDNPDRHYPLDNLASSLRHDFQASGNREALNKAECLQQEALLLRPPGHPDRPESLNSLALVTADQSKVACNPKLLVQALDMHLEAVKIARAGSMNYARALVGLGETLTNHRVRAGELRRFDEAVAVLRDSVPYGFLAPRWRELQGVQPAIMVMVLTLV
jgi:hypothetical protein